MGDSIRDKINDKNRKKRSPCINHYPLVFLLLLLSVCVLCARLNLQLLLWIGRCFLKRASFSLTCVCLKDRTQTKSWKISGILRAIVKALHRCDCVGGKIKLDNKIHPISLVCKSSRWSKTGFYHRLFTAKKIRNRHSGDFYQWNFPGPQSNGPIVIPVNRFSMFEQQQRLINLEDLSRMETLDRRIPENTSSEVVWKKVPVLSRPPLSGTGLRLDYNQRRSCDLSGKQILMHDQDLEVKTDVNRNVTNKSAAKAKKYHKKVRPLFISVLYPF